MVAGVRELARDTVRIHVADAVYDHFLANGFAETTVEEAAKAAGISRATFFRYFNSKEDAVVAALQASQVEFGSQVGALLLRENDTAWALLRRAFEPMVLAAESDPGRVRAKARMILSIPSLQSHLTERRSLQEDTLLDALSASLDDELTRKVLVAAALAAFELAWREWASDSGAPLRGILDGVFARLSDHFEVAARAKL
jgi:AcrR family transcriptional regulator